MISCEGSGTLRLLDYLGAPAGGGEERWLQCGGESGRGPSALLNERVLGLFRFFPCFSNKPCVLQRGAKEVQGQGKTDNKDWRSRLDIGESCNPSELRDRLTSHAQPGGRAVVKIRIGCGPDGQLGWWMMERVGQKIGIENRNRELLLTGGNIVGEVMQGM